VVPVLSTVPVIPSIQGIFTGMSKHPDLSELTRILLEKPLNMHRHLFYSPEIFKCWCAITEDNCVIHRLVSTQYINDYINHEYSTYKRTFSCMSPGIFLVLQSNPILVECKRINVTIPMTITRWTKITYTMKLNGNEIREIFAILSSEQCIIRCINIQM